MFLSHLSKNGIFHACSVSLQCFSLTCLNKTEPSMFVPFCCSVSLSPVSTKQSLPCLFRFVAVFLSHLSKNTDCHHFLFVRLTSSCLPHHPVLPVHAVLPFSCCSSSSCCSSPSCFSSSSGCSFVAFCCLSFHLVVFLLSLFCFLIITHDLVVKFCPFSATQTDRHASDGFMSLLNSD